VTILTIDKTESYSKNLAAIIHKVNPDCNFINMINSSNAYSLASELNPEIIIVDLSPDFKKDFEFIDDFKVKFPETIIIVLTNYSTAKIKESCRKSGVEYFFDKAFELDQMIEYIINMRINENKITGLINKMEDIMDNVSGIQNDTATNELLQLVTFKLENEEFGVDILNIQGINRMVEVTKVPNSPDYVEGIINLRGQVIPIIDLRKRLNMPDKPYSKDTRFIVVEFRDKVVGFVVDSVNKVLRIDRKLTEAPPNAATGIESDYITAVGKLEDSLLILLDFEKILPENFELAVN
jgi:purine-binding chemotaxis protein CheW